MFERDATSEPMLEPNSAVTQLPAVYRFGFSNYSPFQVTAYSGWGYLQKHKCMRSSWLWTHSFPIELTRLRVTLTHHGFTVSVNTSARPMKSCTCRRAPFARWFHGENTWSNDAQNTTWIWWFLVLVSTTSSHLYSFSLSLQLTSSSHVFRYMLLTTSIQFTLLYICLLPGCGAYWITCCT